VVRPYFLVLPSLHSRGADNTAHSPGSCIVTVGQGTVNCRQIHYSIIRKKKRLICSGNSFPNRSLRTRYWTDRSQLTQKRAVKQRRSRVQRTESDASYTSLSWRTKTREVATLNTQLSGRSRCDTHVSTHVRSNTFDISSSSLCRHTAAGYRLTWSITRRDSRFFSAPYLGFLGMEGGG